ncbi:MAG: hypothetical protein HYZ14_13910 [Bacteroidetes bacterium]|nr:hypothetical protein [Bacteroidota bacterium]
MTNSPIKYAQNFNKEEHLFRYSYSDGFGERLLSFEVLVDLDFNFILTYNTHTAEQIKQTGILPDNICHLIEELSGCDLSLIGADYNIHEGASDFSSYAVKVNKYGEIWNFMIGETPVVTEKISNEEKVFFNTLNLLKDWVINRTGYETN